MADKKITALSLIGEAQINEGDLLHIVDDPSGTPINKNMTLKRLFNNVPSFLAFNDVETLDESSTEIEASEAVSIVDFTGYGGGSAVSMVLDAPSHEGQIKIIVRKDDNVAQDLNINATGWNTGTTTDSVSMESDTSVVLIGIGSLWYHLASGGRGTVTVS